MVLEKTLESPLDCKEIHPVLKEISPEFSLKVLMLKLQSFSHLMQRTDSLAKTLMLKAGGEGDQRGQNGMVGWHHRLDGREYEQAPGAGNGQGSLACFSPWGHKELGTTE